MLARLAHAYGMTHATLGTAAAVLVGLLVQQNTLGVTRQPLPMVWPIAVLHIVLAQLPLRDLLTPVERVAHRTPLSRAARAGFSVGLLAVGAATYVTAGDSRELLTFFLLLTAVGFTAAALARSDPWVWTLGVGLSVIGLAFVTPAGAAVSDALLAVPVPAAAASAAVACCLYATQELAIGGRTAGLPRRRANSRSADLS